MRNNCFENFGISGETLELNFVSGKITSSQLETLLRTISIIMEFFPWVFPNLEQLLARTTMFYSWFLLAIMLDSYG